MDIGIIIALILGVSSIITSLFWGFLPNVRKRKIERLEVKLLKALRDIEFLYNVEDKLLSELSSLTNGNKEGLKRKYREESKKSLQIEPSEYIKPSVRSNELQKLND